MSKDCSVAYRKNVVHSCFTQIKDKKENNVKHQRLKMIYSEEIFFSQRYIKKEYEKKEKIAKS
jgi:hypothetical protein